MHPLPVLVEGFFSLGGWIHEVIHKLLEGDIVTPLKSFWLRVQSVPPHYLCAISFMKSCVVAPRKFVAVCRHEPLEGLTDKDELQVGAQALINLGGGVLGQRAEVPRDVSLIGRDRQWVSNGACSPRENHEHPLPVGAGHFGYIAVEQAVLIVHDNVLQVLGDEDSAFAGVGAAGFFQHLPSSLMGHLYR